MSYYPDHQGHECDVAHTRLRKEQREQVAVKLAAGIPFDDVLDSLHVASACSGLTALQFVRKKDMHNIAHEFGINKGEVLHKNNAESVAAWAERSKADPSTRNTVRLLKFQGEASADYNLNEEDFMLVIATDAQLIGAKQFCGPMKEICMDSTHGMNTYEFQLTTLLAIDEHGEGFPVAFCYSNSVDERTMTVFLEVVRDALGQPLRDVVLMTDDAEVYSNAWKCVMGEPAFRLLCTWHVDRAWRRNLNKIKGDMQLKSSVYKTARALLELTSKDQFADKLKEFVSAAKEDIRTAEFGAYFEREYAPRPEVWAYCHRLDLKVHHNMHLEAMHRVLKHVHLQGRKVCRLDKSIHALLKFLRDKMSDRLLKIHKGKWSRHTGGIRKRHQASLALGANRCSCLEENTVYTVQGTNKNVYTVRKADTLPHVNRTCPLLCRDCQVCVHGFSCSCVDSALRNTICKHIHLVVQTYNPVCSYVTGPVAPVDECVGDDDIAADDVVEVEEDEIPELACETVSTGHQALPDVSESEAVLNQRSQQRNSNVETTQLVATVELLWTDFLTLYYVQFWARLRCSEALSCLLYCIRSVFCPVI